MAWPEIQSLGGSLRKIRVTGMIREYEMESGLALIVGESHSLNLEEAAAFGFTETDKGSAIISASDLSDAWRSGSVRVFVAPKTTFLLSDLVKFAPGFDRSMITQANPPVADVSLKAATHVVMKKQVPSMKELMEAAAKDEENAVPIPANKNKVAFHNDGRFIRISAALVPAAIFGAKFEAEAKDYYEGLMKAGDPQKFVDDWQSALKAHTRQVMQNVRADAEQEQAAQSVASPAADSVPESQAKPPAPKKEKIVDAGIKIGRARKDFYSRRIVSSDVAGMTGSERNTFIKKAKLWTYSPSEARENGVEYGVVEFIQKMRANLPEFDAVGGSSYSNSMKLELYVDFCNVMAEHLHVGIKSKHQLFEALTKLHENLVFKNALQMIETGSYVSREFRKMRKFSELASDAPRRMKSADGLPLEQVKPGDLIVYRYSDLIGELAPSRDDDEDTLKRKVRHLNAAWGKLCKTRKTVTTSESVNETKKAQKPDRPHLDHLQNAWIRKNPDGSAADINAQDLIDRFGFRGVEFGEWLPQDERQTVLNESYAACAALVETLGIPDSMASLNGELSIAFGSRGKGRAAAHYEPDLKVFNLTRMNGAGSMAHEWGHALDYYLAKEEHLLRNNQTSIAPIESLIERVQSPVAPISEEEWRERSDAAKRDGMHNKVLSGVMQMVRVAIEKSFQPDQSMNDLQAAIGKHLDFAVSWIADWSKYGGMVKLTTALREAAMHIYGLEADEKDLPEVKHYAVSSFNFADRSKIRVVDVQHTSSAYDTVSKSIKYIVNKLDQTGCIDKEKLAKAKNSRNFESNLRAAFNSLGDYRRYLVSPDKAPPLTSQFAREAEHLDKSKSKSYYATGKELFARAFESYVFDKLHDAGMPCDYLVHSVEGSKFADKDTFTGNPYPEGSERQQINEAMERLACIVSEYATKAGWEFSVTTPVKLRA